MISQPPVGSPIHNIYLNVKVEIDREIVKHGGTRETVLETRHLEKIDHILDAPTAEEAGRLAKRAFDSVFITLLHLRAKGKITPKTPTEYFKKADRAEALSHMFYKQYLDSQAQEGEERHKILMRSQRQEIRATNLRAYAAILVGNPDAPPFEVMFKTDEESHEEEEEVKEEKPKKARVVKLKKGVKTTRRRKSV